MRGETELEQLSSASSQLESEQVQEHRSQPTLRNKGKRLPARGSERSDARYAARVGRTTRASNKRLDSHAL